MSYYVRLIGHTAFVDNISRTFAVKVMAMLLHNASREEPGSRGRTGRRAAFGARGPRLGG